MLAVGLHDTPTQTTIQPILGEIRDTIQRESSLTGKPTMLIAAGDLNRHHPAWSSNRVHHRAMEHAEELVNFFSQLELQWCLPRGTPTFWSLTHPGKTSTIDLTVTDSPRRLLESHLHHEHYGSDHRATYTEWALYPEHRAEPKPKRAYERANWAKIGSMIQTTLEPWPSLDLPRI